MIDLTKAKKVSTIVARGEFSNHSHIVVGDAEVLEYENELYIDVKSEASLKHLLEKEYVEEGKEVWTKEHLDIPLEKGLYKYIPQVEFDPYNKEVLRRVLD